MTRMTDDELKAIEARAKSLRERLIAKIVAPIDLLEPWCGDLEILTASLRAAREALRFYALADNYDEYTELRKFAPGFGTYDADTCKVLEDGGTQARKALGEE